LGLLAGVVAASTAFVAGAFVPAPHSGGDNAAYLSLAYSLLRDGSYTEIFDPAGLPHTKYPPVFPLLLAGLMALGARTWVAFKGVAAVATVAVAALTFLWAERRVGTVWAAGVALLVASSSAVVFYSHWILSDPVFVALTLAGLWALEGDGRAREAVERHEGGAGAGRWWLAAGIAAAGLAYFTRSAGLPLVLAVWVGLALRRRWRALAAAAVSLGVPMVLWMVRARQGGEGDYVSEFWLVDPYDPGLGSVGLGGLLARVAENAAGYVMNHVPAGIVGAAGTAPALLGMALVAAAVAGWALEARRRLGPAELFLPLYAGLILLWPAVWSGDRFALPLYPLLFVYAALALKRGAGRMGGALPAAAGAVGFLLVFVPALGAWTDASRNASNCSAAVRAGGPFACYPPGVTAFVEAAAWAGANLPEGAAVLSRKPRIFYVMGGVPSRTFPFTDDPSEHLSLADALGARYVLLDEWDGLAGRYVGGAVMADPGAYCAVRAFGPQGGTRLLGILPPEGRGTGSTREGDGVRLVTCPPPYVAGDGSAPYAVSSRVPLLDSPSP
jgi:4-amino-4-deoxy-L-arabinose transferase-like glycosyltransferase